jgi:hypothetical protein
LNAIEICSNETQRAYNTSFAFADHGPEAEWRLFSIKA